MNKNVWIWKILVFLSLVIIGSGIVVSANTINKTSNSPDLNFSNFSLSSTTIDAYANVTEVNVFTSRNKNFLAILSNNKTNVDVIKITTKEGKLIRQHRVVPYSSFAISDNGETLVAFGDVRWKLLYFTNLAFYNSSGELVKEIKDQNLTSMSTGQLSHTGNFFALNVLTSNDGPVLILFDKQGNELWRRCLRKTPSSVGLTRNEKFIVATTFSTNEDDSGKIYFFDKEGTLLAEYNTSKGFHDNKMYISPDGAKTIVVEENKIYYFKTETGQLIWKKEVSEFPSGKFVPLEFSDDYIVTSFITNQYEPNSVEQELLFNEDGLLRGQIHVRDIFDYSIPEVKATQDGTLSSAISLGSAIRVSQWPRSGTKKVCGNYGVYEEAPKEKFHPGIDIPGTRRVTKVLGVKNGQIGYIWDPCSDVNQIELKVSNNEFYWYQHIQPLPKTDPNYIPLEVGKHITKGKPFALFRKAGCKGGTFGHIHLDVMRGEYYGNGNYHGSRETSINPLIAYGNIDPSASSGDDKPDFGEIFYKRGAKYEWDKVEGKEVISGDIDIVVEITDDQGHVERTGTVKKYGKAIFNGIISAPYKVGYWIDGPDDHDKKNTGTDPFLYLCEFNSYQNNKMAAIYDKNLKVNVLKGIRYDYLLYYCYCFKVTNTGGDESKFWDTDLKKRGGVAKHNNDAEYPDDLYNVIVKAEDMKNAKTHEYEVYVDNFYPTVEITIPTKDATCVPLDTNIVVTFDEKMNTDSVESAFSISPSVSGTFTWSNNNKNLIFNPSSDLEKGTAYTVTISTGAKDVAGKGIDGDSDGDVGPAYSWSFNTGPPPDIWVNPESFYVRPQRGDITNRTLTIGNNGTGVLVFNISGGSRSGGDPVIGIVQEGGSATYETLLSNLGYTWIDVPATVTASWLEDHNIDILIQDGYGSFSMDTTQVLEYQTFYNNGGTLWISYDDVYDTTFEPEMRTLCGASDFADIPESQTITFITVTYPNGEPTNVYGCSLDFGEDDQEHVTPDTCVVLDNKNESTILDGGNKFVLYLGDSVGSVSEVSATGTLGLLFSSFVDMWKVKRGGSWLSVSPPNGTVYPNNCTNITVTVNATSLEIGNYNATLVINNNDPDENPMNVPMHLRVIAVSSAVVTELDINPEVVIQGENVSIFGRAAPNETVWIKSSFESSLPVSEGKYLGPVFTRAQYSFSDDS